LAYRRRRRRMQPLRQRIIDSTGAHPRRADTPVQARAPTHAPLATMSGSRIHGTRDRASAFPTFQNSTVPHTHPIAELDEHAGTHTPTILSDHHLNAVRQRENIRGKWARETV